MHKALITFALVGTLVAGFFLLKPASVKTETVNMENIYNQWKADYNIHVGASEDTYRFAVFTENYNGIEEHNAQPGITYELGLNEFTHLTSEEFAATHLGVELITHEKVPIMNAVWTAGLPTSVDWTSKMNPVRNQGRCGSCWAFSAVGALEGAHSSVKGNLYQLSEQELVDCGGKYGTKGCSGGFMDPAFDYARDNHGLASATDYPYVGADGQCRAVSKRVGPVTGHIDVKANSADSLKAALARQPVAVAVQADSKAFQSFKSGVVNDSSCGTNLNHGVVAVGYDLTGPIPYYNVRNSWGPAWGMGGHIRIGIQDGKGICGIQMAASYPTV